MVQDNLKTTKNWNFMMKVEVHKTTPPTCACAVCQLKLRAETTAVLRNLAKINCAFNALSIFCACAPQTVMSLRALCFILLLNLALLDFWWWGSTPGQSAQLPVVRLLMPGDFRRYSEHFSVPRSSNFCCFCLHGVSSDTFSCSRKCTGKYFKNCTKRAK